MLTVCTLDMGGGLEWHLTSEVFLFKTHSSILSYEKTEDKSQLIITSKESLRKCPNQEEMKRNQTVVGELLCMGS